MYTLKDTSESRPFAILKSENLEALRTAIMEEYQPEEIIEIKPFLFPDWGTNSFVQVTYKTDDGETQESAIELFKLVSY